MIEPDAVSQAAASRAKVSPHKMNGLNKDLMNHQVDDNMPE
jgi:hypothetical protein